MKRFLHCLVLAFLLSVAPQLGLAAPTAKATPPKTVYLVPAADPVLATLLLAAKGLREPVLLFDTEDQANIRQTVALWPGPRACFYRQQTPRSAVSLMESISGQVCTEVESLDRLVRELWPSTNGVVLFPEAEYPDMLRAASLAANLGVALWPVSAVPDFRLEALGAWKPPAIYTVGSGWDAAVTAAAQVQSAADALAVVRRRDEVPPPTSIVITNPSDRRGIFSPSSLSLVAPLISAAHRAPLVLVTDADPAVVEREVTSFIDTNQLATTHIVLVGDEIGLRSHRIPDPVLAAGGALARGGGRIVRVELFSEIERDRPQDFAVGRIVADNAVLASLNLARRLHGLPARKGRPAIFLANADQIFSLGETISRVTVQDLQNVGVPVRAFYRDEITPEVTQQSLTQTDLLVWEGHPRDMTLEERGGIAVDSAPQVVVLQGCYTLDRSDPFILIEKGTQAIVATTAAIYSASGSALARAFLDAAVQEGVDLGTALRNARNYLLAIAHLKRDRGHADWRKTWRAAMAFALWGDPTMKMPIKAGKPTQPAARWQRLEQELSLSVPKARMRPIVADKYRARAVPRAMLSGILWRDPGDERRWIREMFYTVVASKEGATTACSADDQWAVASLYAPRSKSLFVLALPEWAESAKQSARREVRFPLRSDPSLCRAELPTPAR